MEACSEEKLAAWLFEKFSDTAFCDYIPRENLNLICERATSFFYSGGKLEIENFMSMLETEYDVPQQTFLDVINSLQDEAQQALGVEIILPGEEESSSADKDQRADSAPDTAAESAETMVIGPPTGGAVSEDEMISWDGGATGPADRQETGAESASFQSGSKADEQESGPSFEPSPKAIIRKEWQLLPPTPRDPLKNLGGYLHDVKYLEWVILYLSHYRVGPKDPIIKHIIQKWFDLSQEEIKTLKESDLDPDTQDDSVAAWILRMNGMALSYSYALELVEEGHEFVRDDMIRAVRQLSATFGEIMPRIMAKQVEANKIGGVESEAFETTFKRLKKLHGRIEPLPKKLASDPDPAAKAPARTSVPAKGRARPARPSGPRPQKSEPSIPTEDETGLRRFLNNNSSVMIAVAFVIITAAVLLALYSLGIVGSGGIKSIQVDLSGIDVAVQSVTAQNNVLVVVVDLDSWKGLNKAEIGDNLVKLYRLAEGAQFDQVQVRSEIDGGPLAHVWSESSYRIFQSGQGIYAVGK